jgi:WD40 repeat protein
MSGISEHNPFVGPRPLQRGEPLYGRDAEVRELYNRLQARRIVVLHSPSGAGKSSLVQAGLIPRLVEGGYDVWKPIRVNLDPAGLDNVPSSINRYILSAVVSLEDELPAERRRSPAQLAGLDLLEYIEGRPRRKGRQDQPVVLIFDQFEEVLTVAPLATADKRNFFGAVGRALESERCWALFIIREDYLAACTPYRERIPTQLSNTFRLDLLDLAVARETARKLAERGGRTFPAVDKLVRDLSMVQVQQTDGSFVAEPGPYVEPVHLQVVCRRLWDAMPEDELSIDLEDLEAYAGVSEALAGYYADVVRAIAQGDLAEERALREWMGRRLIVGGIRSQVRREVGRTAGLDNAQIGKLLDSYVVRTEQRAGAQWFELSHDRLVEPVLRDNAAWENAHLHTLQVQAKLWEDGRRSLALLLGAEALLDAQAWAKDNPSLLTESEREFLDQSQEQWTKEQEARQRLLKALEEAERAKKEARAQADRARDASLMAGARELLVRGHPGPAAHLLLEVKAPEEVRGWSVLARESLVAWKPDWTLLGINQVAWSPDGQHLVAAGYHRTACVWKADGKGEPIALRGHRGRVLYGGWSPDGRRIVTWSTDKTLRVWMADGTREPIVLKSAERFVEFAMWSPDSRRIAIVSTDRTVSVRMADGSGEPIELRGHDGKILSAAWSPDGRRISTSSGDKTARVWNADGTGMPIVLIGHTREVRSAVWSPDGRSILTASKDKTARIWNIDGMETPVVLRGHESELRFALWSPDGRRIVTASLDKTARIWSADGSVGPVILSGHEGEVRYADWSPDGEFVLTASMDRTARVWRADGTGEPVILGGHENAVRYAKWSPDGQRIITRSEGNVVRVWRVDTGESVVLRGHQSKIGFAAWSPDGQRIATASHDRTVQVWRGDGTGVPLVLSGHEDKIRTAAWSPDGRYIVTGSVDRTARVWTAEGSAMPVILTGHEHLVDFVAWSPDCQWVVTASIDKSARVWRADGTGEPVVLKGHEGIVRSATWSPDGRHIVTASEDQTARVWRADGTGGTVALSGHKGYVKFAAWSPDGQCIVTASGDKTARVWHADGTGESVVLHGHEDGVWFAAWSPDGRRILTVSNDKTARVWPADGTGVPVVLRHDGLVGSAAWSPDGKRILTASADKTTRVWNADGTGEPAIIKRHDNFVSCASWSPDGHYIVTALSDYTARIWSVTIPALRRSLQAASNDCLTPEMRMTYLGATEAEARAGYEECVRSYGRMTFESQDSSPESASKAKNDDEE